MTHGGVSLIVTCLLVAGTGAALARPGESPRAGDWPVSVVGVADVQLVGEGGRVSSRLIFAAAVEPLALRVEVVRGGRAQAFLWADADHVRVLVPDDPPLLFEGPATRAALGEALGLPFCPEELVFALRAGRAPRPACSDTTIEPSVQGDGGRITGLWRERDGAAPAVRLRFSRFQRSGARTWPRRARLTADGTQATIDFSTVEERDVPPAELAAAALGSARSVTAEEMARVLGWTEDGAP